MQDTVIANDSAPRQTGGAARNETVPASTQAHTSTTSQTAGTEKNKGEGPCGRRDPACGLRITFLPDPSSCDVRHLNQKCYQRVAWHRFRSGREALAAVGPEEREVLDLVSAKQIHYPSYTSRIENVWRERIRAAQMLFPY
nr:hypothetical protein CFP56_10193 [Quercus suber]